MASAKSKAAPELRAIKWCSLFTVIYILVIFLMPDSKASLHSYDVSSVDYNAASLIVAVPSIIVWFVSFIGYTKLRSYASLISKTNEGPHFDRLSTGTTWLAWSLPLMSIFNHTTSGVAHKVASFHATSIILNNYFDMILTFISFAIIGSAVHGIIMSNKKETKALSSKLIMVVFIVLGLSYCYLTLRAFDLSSLSSTQNPYKLPAWLMIVSVIIPYMYAWFVGLLASYQLTLAAKNTTGILYRRALYYIVGGLIAIILAAIAVQYLNGVIPSTGHFVLNYKSFVVITFRVVSGLGFISLATGANRLKKIEEV
jgi:hypothetical protein